MGHPAVKSVELDRPTCLLVEDTQFDQRRVMRMMKGVAHLDIMIVSSLKDARSALATHEFDLMLLDNALPDGFGVDYALELRKEPRHAELPIIIVSDFPSPFMFDKAATARVSRTLTKNEFRPHHVREVLKEAGR